jgi:hypothetical protein
VAGIVFVVLLFASAALASLPTAVDPEAVIRTFYRDNALIVVIQQALGAAALAPFAAFALSLKPNRFLRPALFVFIAVELVTNVVPLLILASPDSARPLTQVEDIADDALFLAMAIFVLAAALGDATWARVVSYVVALVAAARGLGVGALGLAAPLLFIAFVLLLSVRNLVARPAS